MNFTDQYIAALYDRARAVKAAADKNDERAQGLAMTRAIAEEAKKGFEKYLASRQLTDEQIREIGQVAQMKIAQLEAENAQLQARLNESERHRSNLHRHIDEVLAREKKLIADSIEREQLDYDKEEAAFWERIEQMRDELYRYAYIKNCNGFRFPDWEESAMAYSALERMLERRSKQQEQ